MSKEQTIESRIDYSLILPVFFLLVVGFLSVYISTVNDYPHRVLMVMIQQALWILIGCCITLMTMLINVKHLWKSTPFLYVLGLGLMVLPLIYFSPVLYNLTGAKNWIVINNMTLFQPSEFMKIAYILVLARVTISFQKKYPYFKKRENWLLLSIYFLITLPIMILLALQKDFGTALVFVAILTGILVLSGISWKILGLFAGGIMTFIVVFLGIFLWSGGKELLFNLGMDTYQLNRISAWLDPFEYASGIAYQQTQGMISVGTGGMFGKGFNEVELSVPVRESDMIFTVIAENFGFLGSVLVLGSYLLLFYRMLRTTFISNNRFYIYVSIGFIMMILFHVFENIGAVLGILPLTGIPLPFISQGGSSLISNLIGVGIVLSISFQNQTIKTYQKPLESEKNDWEL